MRQVPLTAIVFGLLCATVSAQSAQQFSNVRESVPQGTASRDVVSISLSNAIDRALRYNLGMFVSESETRVARSERMRALADLLPNVRLAVTEDAQQINLAAYGFNGFAGGRSVIGPFGLFQAGARLSAPIVDVRLVHELRKESQELAAANFSQQNVRELVVLITTDLYLESIADAARVDSARAQLRTAQAVYDRAVNMKNAGAVPAIDVLRAQVQLQGQQQRLVAVENELAKQKLTLAKAIGLPLEQQFNITDVLPAGDIEMPDAAQALETALAFRADYLRARASVRAAEESLKAAQSRRLPALALNSQYSDMGHSPVSSHGTFVVEATVSAPLFDGGRIKGEIEDAKAVLDRRKAEADSLQFRIEYDIRTARLDIQSATEQVRVARSANELAGQQIVQAQDRFSAGVADSLEVVQAQQALATANENYTSGLFALNAARASLAHAIGNAESMIKQFFGGR
jgi:outer membrane protein TolC